MNCPKCSAFIDDDMLTCPECGEQIAVNAQKKKISSAYNSAINTIKGRTKASSFLTATIFLTIMLVLHIIAVFGTMGIGLPLWSFRSYS